MASPELLVLGAADTVTGSRYLLSYEGHRVLVDCGLFQGYKPLRDRNWAPFPVDPASIDAVVVTHAHLDHSGYLPALVRDGFRGDIHVTRGTAELVRILLLDSAHLQEEEADHHRRHGTSRHADPRALYTTSDAEVALTQLREHDFDADVPLAAGFVARFRPAGHIVGAAQVQVLVGGTRVHFTGDLGRPDDPIMKPPAPLEPSDYLIVESTYGDRSHPDVDARTQLGEVVRRVVARHGVVVIPAFAVGRAESLTYHLSRLQVEGRIPRVPIYLNSPMAVSAHEIYGRHADELRLTADEIQTMADTVRIVRTVDESKQLNEQHGPMIIISASGMLTGGRILHHVTAFGPDPRNAIVLSGYQSGGTRGAALARGERTLRIFGRDVPIAAEVVQLESLSAHADAEDILDWMRHTSTPPRLSLVTHGDPAAADTLRARIQRELGWAARVPNPLDVIALETP